MSSNPNENPPSTPAPIALRIAGAFVRGCTTLAFGASSALALAQDPPVPAAPPADEGKAWIDPEDGWLDVSKFLEHPAGFLPLIIPITEPTLGYGAVLAAAFLDPREEAGDEGWARPNITIAGGMLTEDGSDGLFAANSSIWDDGDLHTLVGAGSLGLELDFYGLGDDSSLAADSLGYRLGVQGVFAEVRRRIGDSGFWAGVRFAYARTEVDFEGDASGLEGVDGGVEDLTVAGPALTLRFDSFDNALTPTRGFLADANMSFFDDAFGGSRDYQLFQQVLIGHHPIAEDVYVGVRAQYTASFGDVPFFSRPYVDLRGVPALRYQGEQALSGEAEMRWQFHPRWSVLGFGGLGVAWTDEEDFHDEQDAWSVGSGFRYVIARKFGLHMGLDVAWGPEEGAVYVQFGNAWMRM